MLAVRAIFLYETEQSKRSNISPFEREFAWLFLKVRFRSPDVTCVVHMTHCEPLRITNALIVGSSRGLITFVALVAITTVEKSLSLVKLGLLTLREPAQAGLLSPWQMIS